ncbi:hypothetical protein CNMCM6069_000258 [Aspergillus lentulus]|nr:hypothetical protein CNMCM6069_000258 [Aspergillus lentulus]KAF4173144.1 hypothetical protein CNMCM8060_000563 [Aspergillus lentulus]KAF4192614.1 hypothetical protein CNMCM8694_000149 [Aspergillus lentulus]
MIEDRLHLDPSKTQRITSAALSIHALVCFVSGPVIGHLADKVSSRKGPLLLSVVGEIIGTILVAAAPSVFFFGRVVQAFAGNAAWIIGFATIADTVEAENRSRTISTISVFFISGMLFGPMMSGSLIGLVGYWPTWLAAIAVLILDAIMLFLMVETPKSQRKDVESASGADTGTGSPDETSSLLSGPAPAQRDPEQSPQQNGSTKRAAESFYKIILSNPRALTSMVCHATISLTLACFDTTLPLHVSRTFGWGPFQTSLMFLLLQVPTLLLSPLTGWMKDRWGTKIPSGVGFLAHAPLLWLLGAAGRKGLPLVGSEQRGKTIYTVTIVSLGIVRTLVTGCGTIEMTNVVTELQETQPAIFGPNGGYSRAFSLTNMSWTFSMFLGPILSGALTETVGYYYMNIWLVNSTPVASTPGPHNQGPPSLTQTAPTLRDRFQGPSAQIIKVNDIPRLNQYVSVYSRETALAPGEVYYYNPIWIAAEHGSTDALRLLLEEYADNSADSYGWMGRSDCAW